MIGFNGGLIGSLSTPNVVAAPGVWTPVEQSAYTGNRTWPLPTLTDPYFGNVVLLVNFDGTNGSTAVVDSSIYGRSLSCVDNAAITTTNVKWGTGAIQLDSVNDSVTALPGSDFNYETRDFTMEAWGRLTSTGSYRTIFSHIAGSSILNGFVVYATPLIFVYYNNSPGPSFTITGGSVSTNTWHHIALTRSGNTFSLWLNGALQGSTTISLSMPTGIAPRIGNWTDILTRGWLGQIDDFRITKGTCRYTGTFTPPTAAFPAG